MKPIKLSFTLLLVASVFYSCQKYQGPELCLKGRVVATQCMGTIIQIIEGNFDSSLVTTKWRDSLKIAAGLPAPELAHVFRLINPCKYGLREGDEFYFSINPGKKEDACAYCLALDILPPPRANAITICGGMTSK